jgi:chaperonin GroES
LGCIRELSAPCGERALALSIRQCQRSHKFWSEETINETAPIAGPRPGSSCRAGSQTAGGIFIPDTAQEKPMEGEVVAVGPGARDADGKLHPLEVKTGDRVLFGKWSGTEVKLDGEDLMIMKESDIMGVVDHAAANKKAA